MPSFDIVSRVDVQELDNIVNMVKKETSTRYDFRDSHTEINLDRKTLKISVDTSDTMKCKAVGDILADRASRRHLDVRIFKFSDPETSGKRVKMSVEVQTGIDRDHARSIVKWIKETKLKVQAQIQDEQVRVTGKKIDDLQTVIQMCREKNLPIPLQFINMKK